MDLKRLYQIVIESRNIWHTKKTINWRLRSRQKTLIKFEQELHGKLPCFL